MAGARLGGRSELPTCSIYTLLIVNKSTLHLFAITDSIFADRKIAGLSLTLRYTVYIFHFIINASNVIPMVNGHLITEIKHF